ncbi:MAG: elongation factor G, partial [Caulobacteraceae bacterium]
MPTERTVRALALAGPTGAGKTALMEAMLLVSGAVEKRAGGGAAEKIGDSSPEAKARGHSVEINLAGFEFLGDRYAVVDCPGSLELVAEADAVFPAMDLAVVVTDPEADKAALAQPVMRELEELAVPRAIFVNKIDQARGSLEDLLRALASTSAVPLVARQLPIVTGEKVTGFVDLALEKAFVYRSGEASEVVELTSDLAPTEPDARFHMLEQLADFDDELMEQLLSDAQPSREAVFADLVREMNEGLIVPVFFGSAQGGFGVRRLLKALRHETPLAGRAAARLGIERAGAYVLKAAWAGQAGKLAYARVFGGALPDSADLVTSGGEHGRAGGLFHIQGAALKKIARAEAGDIVAIGKIETVQAGEVLALGSGSPPKRPARKERAPLFALAVAAANRKDDVRLSGALSKLLEEDAGLALAHDVEGHQMLLMGQGEGHVRLALERLKRRYGVDIVTEEPKTPYRETIRAGSTQRGRHKKQTGGHGQFADVTVEIKPKPRGSGFSFASKITGGVVPRQWIPAVEQGVRDGLARGPLGFPVVDLEVTLLDGQFHSVDSSELAFRLAGRIAIDEGLKGCGSTLLEPVEKLKVHAPSSAMSSVTSALTSRRGQILGFGPRQGWPGWEEIEAYLPQSERHDFIAELRSLTQGLGSYDWSFDHMAELTGRLAEDITQKAHKAHGHGAEAGH